MSHNEPTRVLGMSYLHSYVSIRFTFKKRIQNFKILTIGSRENGYTRWSKISRNQPNRRILLCRKCVITSPPECWDWATFTATCPLGSHSKTESKILRFWRLDLEKFDKSDDRNFHENNQPKNFARSEMSHNEHARVLGMCYLHSYVSIRFPFKKIIQKFKILTIGSGEHW